jgi:hypothetical protein
LYFDFSGLLIPVSCFVGSEQLLQAYCAVRRFPSLPRSRSGSVLWFDNSNFTLYIAENNFTQAGIMHTYRL